MSITTGECFKCSHVKCTLTNVTLEDETFWRERNKWREVGDVFQEDDDCRCSGTVHVEMWDIRFTTRGMPSQVILGWLPCM